MDFRESATTLTKFQQLVEQYKELDAHINQNLTPAVVAGKKHKKRRKQKSSGLLMPVLALGAGIAIWHTLTKKEENRFNARKAAGRELVPVCSAIRDLLPTANFAVIANQRVNGKIIRGSLSNNVLGFNKLPFAVKFTTFAQGEDPRDQTLRQNYEARVINLLQPLLTDQHTPHLVFSYGTFICRCSEFFPPLSQKLIDQLPTDTATEEMSLSINSFQNIFKIRSGKEKTYSRIVNLLVQENPELPKTNDTIVYASIWAGFLCNYSVNVVFPQISEKTESNTDEWNMAYGHTLALYLLMQIGQNRQLGQNDIDTCYEIAYLITSAGLVPAAKDYETKLRKKHHQVNLKNFDERYQAIKGFIATITTKKHLLSAHLNDMKAVSALLPSLFAEKARIYDFPIRTLLSEWVQGGTLKDVLYSNWCLMNEIDFAVLYFQYLYTRYAIQIMYPGFTHNDGHLGNILVAYEEMREEWPIKQPIERRGIKGEVTVTKSNNDDYQAAIGEEGKPITLKNKPFLVKQRPNVYTEYKYSDTRSLYVPDLGYSLRIWDFDLTNISSQPMYNKGVSQVREILDIKEKEEEFYDVSYLFSAIANNTREYVSNTEDLKECTESNRTIFPLAIDQFHEKYINKCQVVSFKNIRIFDTNKKKETREIIDEELTKGIFTRFLTLPEKGIVENVFTLPKALPDD